MKKYEAPELKKYLSVSELTNGWDTSVEPHGSNVSEGINATYNVWDCSEAKDGRDEYLTDTMCLTDEPNGP